LAGENINTRREREEVLSILEQTDYKQYVVLFKGQGESFHFRALYAANEDEQDTLVLVYGQPSKFSPSIIEGT